MNYLWWMVDSTELIAMWIGDFDKESHQKHYCPPNTTRCIYT